MSRLWITAQPSINDTVARLHRQDLRRVYRRLRRSHPRWEARHIISLLLCAGHQEIKP